MKNSSFWSLLRELDSMENQHGVDNSNALNYLKEDIQVCKYDLSPS